MSIHLTACVVDTPAFAGTEVYCRETGAKTYYPTSVSVEATLWMHFGRNYGSEYWHMVVESAWENEAKATIVSRADMAEPLEPLPVPAREAHGFEAYEDIARWLSDNPVFNKDGSENRVPAFYSRTGA